MQTLTEQYWFDAVKGADAEVRRDIAGWKDKADDYVLEFFDNEMKRVYSTRFGDNLAFDYTHDQRSRLTSKPSHE